MIVIASKNGYIGISDAIHVLMHGGSALDAVEQGIWPVELDTTDSSVGIGGLPNLLGEVELDASIMDGATRAAGSVGALKGFPHPISVARKIMEELPHVFLVGEGAALFAQEMGFSRAALLTPQAHQTWQQRLTTLDGAMTPELERYDITMRQHAQQLKRLLDPTVPNETVNFLAIDQHGHLASGVSTSGWALKYPGRLGDSPVIGAGSYADDRYGAAACTGRGELAIRACTAYATVMAMRAGLSPTEACITALRDVLSLEDSYTGPFSVLALNAHGETGGASNVPDTQYVCMRPGDSAPSYLPRVYVSHSST